jgi:uncharacterized protein YkwD
MPRTLRCTLLLLVLVLVPALGQAAAAVSYQPTTEQQVLELLNQVRRQYGLGILVVSPQLRIAARAHSADMLQRSYFDHNSPGQSFDSRLARYVKSSLIGETVAWGEGSAGTPAGIVGQWMHSAAHRRTILAPALRRVGIGFATGAFEGVPSAVVATADFAA